MAKRLASRSNQLVMASTELTLAAGGKRGGASAGHLAAYAVFVKGLEANGPLMKLGPGDAAVLTGNHAGGLLRAGLRPGGCASPEAPPP